MSREYSQYGFRSGVDSTIGSRPGGFWYAEAELMKTYCPVRWRNRSRSVCTCSGRKAMKSTTTSNSRWLSAERTESGVADVGVDDVGALGRLTQGGGAAVEQREFEALLDRAGSARGADDARAADEQDLRHISQLYRLFGLS